MDFLKPMYTCFRRKKFHSSKGLFEIFWHENTKSELSRMKIEKNVFGILVLGFKSLSKSHELSAPWKIAAP
jgi:hypothetical protein